MNKKLAIVAGLFVALVCPGVVCPGLFAQQIVAMHANIPFDFRMGDKLLPAGTYLIQASDRALVLREEGGRLMAASLLTIPESQSAPPATGELWFHRYGSDYFLASVWTPYSRDGQSLPKTKQERQLARLSGGVVQTAAIHLK